MRFNAGGFRLLSSLPRGERGGGQKRLPSREAVRHERVVCILTGHSLKDPSATVNYHMSDLASREHQRPESSTPKFANRPVPVANDAAAIIRD